METIKEATSLLASYGAEVIEVSMDHKNVNILHRLDLITLLFLR